MDRFTTADLRNLVRAAGGTCVTLCMPTHPASEQGQQDAVRLKNLVNMAEQRLVEQGMRTSDARDMLSPLRDVVARGEVREDVLLGSRVLGVVADHEDVEWRVGG